MELTAVYIQSDNTFFIIVAHCILQTYGRSKATKGLFMTQQLLLSSKVSHMTSVQLLYVGLTTHILNRKPDKDSKYQLETIYDKLHPVRAFKLILICQPFIFGFS